MKIEYRENKSDLDKRIEIHNKYGTKDINKWMIDTLNIKGSMNILDMGCGNGKQSFLFANKLDNGIIIGADIEKSLIEDAKDKNYGFKGVIPNFMLMNFDEGFPFKDNKFDLVNCSFAVYYSKNLDNVVSESYRVLKSRGKLFFTGAVRENKQIFYDLIERITKKKTPFMPSRERFGNVILNTVKKYFEKTDFLVFRNPLVFKEAKPFIDYFKASVSEDRKLWKGLFDSKDYINGVAKKLEEEVNKIIAKDGQFVMEKVVGGILGVKYV